MSYFKKPKDVNDLKQQFRRLCLKHHPDKGGNAEDFKTMMNEYEKLLRQTVYKQFEKKRADFEMEMDAQMRDVLDKIIYLSGVTIEIIGNWLWVSGNTYEVRDILKENGFIFAGKKKAWYWKGYKYHKRSRQQFSLDDLRDMFENAEVETKNLKYLDN